MPRSNHPRRRTSNSRSAGPTRGRGSRGGPQRGGDDEEEFGLDRLRLGIPSTESAPDGVWSVRSISVGNAQKVYMCPGCHHSVLPGVAHLVVWREDAMFGGEAGLRERRHWHSNCWRGRSYKYR